MTAEEGGSGSDQASVRQERLPVGWRERRIDECLSRSRHRRLPSVPRSEYLASGRYPVVDQGAVSIAGFTYEESVVYPQEALPVVVFGDHTRVVKYVDHPFATGADGTKLLWVKDDISPSYFAYSLRSLDIPSRGYNRHFRLLVEQTIRFPEDRGEQEAIAASLTTLERALGVARLRVEALRELRAAMQAKALREGLYKEPTKDTDVGIVPDSWRIMALDELGEIVTGTTPPTRDPANYDGGTIPFTAPGDFGPERWVRETEKKLSERGASRGRKLPKGTVLVVCIGATIGKVGMSAAEVSCTNQQINAVIPFDEYPPAFLYYVLSHNAPRLRALASPGPVPILNKRRFSSFRVAVPTNPTEREELANTLDRLDNSCEVAQQQAEKLETSFAEILPALVTGQVRIVGWSAP